MRKKQALFTKFPSQLILLRPSGHHQDTKYPAPTAPTAPTLPVDQLNFSHRRKTATADISQISHFGQPLALPSSGLQATGCRPSPPSGPGPQGVGRPGPALTTSRASDCFAVFQQCWRAAGPHGTRTAFSQSSRIINQRRFSPCAALYHWAAGLQCR